MLHHFPLRVVGPVLCDVHFCSKRFASSVEHYLKYGSGGRSSFNGVVATVFGATGFLGRYVVNRLAQCGTQIVVPYRGDEQDTRHIRVMGDLGQIVFREYHLKDQASIEKTVTHSNVVINLVGREFPTRNFSFEDCLVNGAKSIASAAREAGVQRFVHVSHLSAAGNSQSLFLQAKAKGERVVVDSFPGATIIRPAEFYGHEDRYLHKYAYLHRLPFGIPLVQNGWKTIKRPCCVLDVAQAIVNASKDDSAVGRTYELYGPEAYYLHDLVEYVVKLIRKPFRSYNCPEAVYNMIGWIGEKSIFNPRITRDMVYRQFLSNDVQEDMPTFEDLGITPMLLHDAALEFLRRHRDYYHYNEILDSKEVCPPVSAHQ